MAYQEYMTLPGLVAAGDLSSKQKYVVRAASTAGAVKVATTPASDKILGILMNDPADGEPAMVAHVGVVHALAESGVGYGDKLTCSSTGRVKTTSTTGDEVIGIALAASGAAGDVIPVALARSEI